MRNPPIEIDATEKYPYEKNRKNKRESKPTQYLMRFGNLPTSLGQGREILLIQQSIQVVPYFKKFLREIFSRVQFMRALTYIIARES